MTKDRWVICPTCRGDETTVNPSIDAHGLTAEDFYDDPDFAEDYRCGVYDIPCGACGGSGKMRQSRLVELEQAAADRRLAAQEDGDFNAYSVVGDWRYGA